MSNIVSNKSLTGIRDFLNDNFTKKSKTKFTVSDVQGYINRGKLPTYLGGNKIVRVDKIQDVKLYNIKS